VIDRNVLEWRLAPDSSWRIADATGPDVRVIVLCNEGYSSSLAAATLKELGLVNATDVIGGFQAWKAAGLPVGR
ncbi:MAG TPA: rhodanese-like domain-containing protein, partial [Clostridia bacterium]|nr:rhodanese-like domain-containing protein [Clostridia bacterium]